MGCKSSKGATAPQQAQRTLLGGADGKATSTALHRLLCVQIQAGTLPKVLASVNGETKEALLKLDGLLDLDIFAPSDKEIVTYCRYDGEAGLKASEAKVDDALKPLAEYFVGTPQKLSATGGMVTPGGRKVFSLRGKLPVVQYRMARIVVKPESLESLTSSAYRPETVQAFEKIQGLQAVNIIAAPDGVVITQCSYESAEALQASEAKAEEALAFVTECATGSPERFSASGGVVQLSGDKVFSFPTPMEELVREVTSSKMDMIDVNTEPRIETIATDGICPTRCKGMFL
mmetsp:Transcript_106815/g.184672  ORF Transcript_106815/g.184672 Transcript_106815/m.184672 type:complete len:289 (-) Transcript_106815:193-1059(-)